MKIVSTSQKDIEFNEQFAHAYDSLENTQRHIFITGKAGTGKSTLLQYFRAHTSKRVVVLASTGVAAINVKGQTVHSFFRFKPDITPEGVDAIKIRKSQKKIYENIDTIIIDEISMIRADLLDCIDKFLRSHGPHNELPFGGVQMVFIGDLFQLPPVVTPADRALFSGYYKSPYFFDAKVYKDISLKFIELTKIYRQKEEDFIRLLSHIRSGGTTSEHLNVLNRRLQPSFKPLDDETYIFLTTTNQLADTINQEQLENLQTKRCGFQGVVSGEFEEKNLPTHKFLQLKIGAQVMLLNNDSNGGWINGSIGTILGINQESEYIEVELTDGRIINVPSYTWEMYRFFFNEETETLDSESVGSFTQFPLKLAWAVTIHKSQGQTFNRVVLDIGHGTFSHGQMYVALSRCTSLEGLVLKKPILKKHILLDKRVVNFMNGQKDMRVQNENGTKSQSKCDIVPL